MDVHGTMVGAGQQGNARTHELLVEAGIVSGALSSELVCRLSGQGGRKTPCVQQ